MECSSCGEKFIEQENFEKHVQSEKHKKNELNAQERESDSSLDPENIVSSNSNDSGEINCLVCNLSFNLLESFQNHSTTLEHALKVMKKQAANTDNQSSSSDRNNQLSASKCNVEVATEESILPELNKSFMPYYGNCEVCSKTFSGPKPYKQHLESQAHKKKVKFVQNQSCIQDPLFKCNPCSKSFSGHLPYIQHMISETHKRKLQNHSTTPEHPSKVMKKQAANTRTESPSSDNHQLSVSKCNVESTTEESILPELSDNKSYIPYYGNCEVCSKMFSGPEPYKQHLESQAHKKKVEFVQNQSCVQGSLLKCDSCSKSFSGQVPYTQHMMSETHKRKLQNFQSAARHLSGMDASISSMEKTDTNKLWFCNVCNLQCSGMIPYEQHIAGSIHFKNERRMQNQNNFTKMNDNTTSMMHLSNFNDGKNSEKTQAETQLVTGFQIMNDSYKKNKGSDFEFMENFSKSVVSHDQLEDMITIIPADQKIDFDELDKLKDSENKNLDIIKERENDKDDELRKPENGFDDGLKKTEVVKES